MPNRLAEETSPYLLQHAENPVDWYPWGEEALSRARDEDRLILLSIGYSSCHWCHVMERESFEDADIAALMNREFVNVKVDREERPDLDDIYMAATTALNAGHGGWPMTVFLTPDLEPVFAGTYFPPKDVGGRPGFPRVLQQIAEAWSTDRAAMTESAQRIAQALRDQRAATGPLNVGLSELEAAGRAYAAEFDAEHGGFGDAPKFPPAVSIMLLLRLHDRFGDEQYLEMALKTLDAMAEGGMYDHLGGGFARYSTDRFWLVPHFEKMLYDNALLVRPYLEALQVTGNAAYRRVATEILDYVLREMTSPEGGFYSSTDADSEGVEGKFFVWRPDEVRAVLSDDAEVFNRYYDVTEAGNWEGVSVLHTPRPAAEVAREFNIPTAEFESRLDRMRQRMYEARESRVKPGLDDKVLTAWNGLMISAMAEGYRVLGDERYRDAARAALDYLSTHHRDERGRLLRTSREGRAHLNAYLEDYAYLADGAIDLYEVTGEEDIIGFAHELGEMILTEFVDAETGSFFNTSADHEQLLLRYREGTDGATPAANAVAASALMRLGRHLDRSELQDAAIRSLVAYGPMIQRFPRGFARSLMVVDALIDAPVELVIAGTDADLMQQFRDALAREFIPNRIQALATSPQSALPLLAGKQTEGAALYVCRDYACQAPITDPAQVSEQLSQHPRATVSPTIAVRREGCATSDGTRGYAERFRSEGFNVLGETGLTVSRVGFGGYRTDDATPEHREALLRALSSGINLVDTSTNYMDGASERLIGSALSELINSGEMLRDEAVIVSKIGYIQGTNYDAALARDKRGEGWPETTRIGDGLWHCIHPDFLDDQLNRSLDRLQLSCLDVCLLHNPEYYLSYGGGDHDQDAVKDELYRRMEQAFAYFEEQVDRGRISWYGVSSNTVAGVADDAESTSLERMLAAARSAGGKDHHFRVLQLPLNLFESGAVLAADDAPVIERAAEAGIAVLANRPLNAFVEREMIRLADFITSDSRIDVVAALREMTTLENRYRNDIAERITAPEGALSPAQYFQWSGQLEMLMDQAMGLEQWSQVDHQIRDGVQTFASVLDRNLRGELAGTWSAWRAEYMTAVAAVLNELRQRAVAHAAARSEAVSGAISPLFDASAPTSLSARALWVVASTPGVSAVLAGVRTPEYVEDALQVMERGTFDSVDEVYGAVRAAPYLATSNG